MTNAIIEYSHTEAELAKLRERMSGVVYCVTSPAGMETARKDRRELVSLRTALEAERKRIKAPALERCQMIDAEAKRITGEILKLEAPIDDLIKAEEERRAEEKRKKEEAEQQRIEKIQKRIAELANPLVSGHLTSGYLLDRIERQRSIAIISDEFGEWLPQASAAHLEGIAKLNDMLTATRAAEEEAERQRLIREEEDRRRAEAEAKLAEERERLRVEQESLDKERAEIDRQRQAEEAKRREREAEAQRQADEERRQREEAERKQREEEQARMAEESRKEMAAAQAAFEERLKHPYEALRAILDLAEGPLSDKAARNRIAQAATMALQYIDQEVKA